LRTLYAILVIYLLCNGNLLYGSAGNAVNETTNPSGSISQRILGLALATHRQLNNNQSPVITYSKIDIQCFGDSTGVIDITVSGTSGLVNYDWADGIKTEDRTGLGAGAYTLTVTDDNGSTLQTITIDQPASPLSAPLTGQINVACFGQATGSVIITPGGGTPPYVITPSQTGLATGLHTFTVTDNNGCPLSVDVTIFEPAALLTAVLTGQVNVACFGQATGSVIITPRGGTPPYVITPSQTGLAAGLHTFTITDNNGCPLTVDVTISEPAAPLTTVVTGQVNVACFGQATGSVIITPGGGTPPYVITPSQTGLAAGLHTFTITDNNGCPLTVDVTISEPAAPLTTMVTGQVNVACYGQATGSVTITPAGGTPPYVITPSQTGLAAGLHTFTVTDNNWCPLSVDVTISEPAAPLTAVVTGQVNVACFGQATGSVIIAPDGGTPPYVITPSQTGLAAGLHTFTVTDSNGCPVTVDVTISEPAAPLTTVVTGQVNVACFGQATGSVTITPSGGTPPYVITPSQTALGAGLHIFTVTDVNSCSQSISVTIMQPAAGLTVSTTQLNVLCFGAATGSATAIPAGGTPPYSYSWNTSPVQTTQTATSLIAGSYDVTITDANFCIAAAMVAITQPPALLINAINSNSPICQGANLNLSVTAIGGSPIYTYSWTGPTSFNSTIQNPTISNATPSESGTYQVTVTDANNCSNLSSTPVTINPTPTVSALSTTQTICSSNQTSIALSGPVAGTTFNWTAAQTTGTVSGFTNGSGNLIAQTLINNGSAPASLTYTVTPSANGCNGSSITVVVTVNPIPVVTATPINQTICTGGTSNIMLSSTLPGTTFSWTAAISVGTASGYADGTGNSIAQNLVNNGVTQAIVNYTVTPVSNGCTGSSIIVTVIINPNSTLTLTSASGTNGQTICINNPISNIVYATGGSGTGVIITSGALPAGVTGTYASGIYTISGTPTVTGTFFIH